MADSPSELHAEIEKLERKHAEHPEGRYFVPLANAYRKLGDVEYAESLLREGLRRHPDYLSAHIVLGRCLADRSATREAGDEFRYVLSFDPQNLIALRTLGELAATEGRPAEAERWYEELLAVDPMNDEARRALESLRGAAAVPEVEEEFRPDAAWWEREPAAEEEQQEETAPVQQTGAAAWEEEPVEEEWRGETFVEQESEEAAEDTFESAGVTEGSDSEEVVTETIAELYARQGFYERAAGVYRELIRRRGGDPALERRLAEMEARMGGTEPVSPPPPPAPPSPEPASDLEPELPASTAPPQDTFATSFEDGFFNAGTEREAEPEVLEPLEIPEALEEPREAEEPEEAGEPEEPAAPAPTASAPAETVERETIASYLRALIAWTPGAAGVAETPSEAGAALAPTPEAGPVTEPESTPAPAPEERVEPEPEALRAAEPEAESRPEAESQPEPAAAEPGTGRAEADLFPWELPMDTAPEAVGRGAGEPSQATPPPPEAPAEPEPLRVREEDDFFSFDAFFSDAPAEEQQASTGEVPPAEEPAAPEAKEQEPAAAAEEDDDLESFQAWLRSLKR